MKLNKTVILNTYDRAIDGVDEADSKLNNAETLLEAQMDELTDIGDTIKHNKYNNDTSIDFIHYYDELLALNVAVEDIIDQQRKSVNTHVKPARIGLAKLLHDRDDK